MADREQAAISCSVMRMLSCHPIAAHPKPSVIVSMDNGWDCHPPVVNWRRLLWYSHYYLEVWNIPFAESMELNLMPTALRDKAILLSVWTCDVEISDLRCNSLLGICNAK